jgi:hypothetical protein
MQLLESAAARERVKRIIYDPLQGRGEPPRGWTKEAMIADYVLVLGEYPEDVLARAAAKVQSERTRSTWPLAGEFRDACEKCGGKDTTKARAATEDGERYRISNEAYAYVQARMLADNGALLSRSIDGGWQRECRAYLFERACEAIRNGDEPHVSNGELTAKIVGWEVEATARRRSQAAVLAPRPERPISDVQRAIRHPERLHNTETQRFIAMARGEKLASDLDEEIPLPTSEDDYGAEVAA